MLKCCSNFPVVSPAVGIRLPPSIMFPACQSANFFLRISVGRSRKEVFTAFYDGVCSITLSLKKLFMVHGSPVEKGLAGDNRKKVVKKSAQAQTPLKMHGEGDATWSKLQW